MKKNLTILSVTLTISLFSLTLKAQDAYEQPKSYLTFLMGTSAPFGDFKSTDYSNYKAGFAKSGIVMGFDGAIYVHKNFAVGYDLTFQDQGELTQNDAQTLATGYNNVYNKANTTLTTNGRYGSLKLMVGPQYTFRKDKFLLDLRVSAGALKSTATPTYNFFSDNANQVITQLSSTSFAFAYGASAGLRWSFADNWDLNLKENYINTSGIKISYTNGTGTAILGRDETTQPVVLLQTTLGFTLRF